MMSIVMFLMLIAKHYVFSSLFEIGYSESRHPSTKEPWWSWLRYAAAEVLATILICRHLEGAALPLLVSGEILVMAISCWLERVAPLSQALRMHFYCELTLLFLYSSLLWHLLFR